jgi:3-methyl-2-oxobutanoate hydroxymethyltransferase
MDLELNGNSSTDRKKVSVADFSKMKNHGQRIVMVTSYDYPTSIIADDVGVDSILVGDSYGMVVLGYDTTIPVTMEELLPACQAVRRGASHSLLIGDMPFLSFQISEEDAIRNAGRFIKEGRMEAVKIEGGREMAHVARAVSNAGIPVLGHIGLTPQTATLHGGYRVQGKNADSRESLVKDAKSLEDAGVFGIVLEMITEEAARVITQAVSVPTIGIGSGRYCDGQVLVLHDVLGLYPRFVPKFAKQYADLASTIKKAVAEYASDVRQGTFPEEKHVFKMDDAERDKLDLPQKS